MSESIPTAIVTPKKGFSVVWLIPLLALALGGWLTFTYLHEKGVVIEIEFSSATGLAAGKTKIRYKDVEVGLVDDIVFSPNLETVIVTATINREMRDHLNEKTRFWVVRARVAAGEVSGLETILAGAHIGMEPGESGNKRKLFKALDRPPVLFTDANGSRFQLLSETLHSFEPGAPVYYRRLKVGEVISYKLNPQGTEFNIDVFVHAPYNQLVFEDTQFWNASGVDMQLGADGFQLQTESLVSLLLGGIAFDNLGSQSISLASEINQAASGAVFELYKNKKAAANSGKTRGDRLYRVYFDGSARGLNIGAPVTLRGITVGHVIDVRLEYDLQASTFKIPVTLELEPDRISMTGGEPIETGPSAEELVRRGLRAQLRTGNLLTGQMLIDLDLYPEIEPEQAYYEGDYLVIPTIPNTMDSLMLSLNEIMLKLSELPLVEIGNNLNSMLKGASEITNSGDIRDTISNVKHISLQLNDALAGLEEVVAGMGEVVQGIDEIVHSSEVEQALVNIQSASERLDETLATVDSVVTGYSEDSDAYQSLLRLMHELSGAARSLRQMADYLERHPEALLKGKGR